MFIDRSYREPLALAPQMQNDPVKGLHGICLIPGEYAVRIDRVWHQRRHAYCRAGLISPTPRSLVRRSSFTPETKSEEASSVYLRRLAAGGVVLVVR